MQIKEIKISDIKLYKHNNKTHTKKQIDLLKQTIQEFGYTNPVILSEDNECIGGHGRIQAMQELGKETIPAVYIKDLTPEQVRKLRLLDNKIAELAEDNLEAIKFELEELDDPELNELYDLDIETLDPDKEAIEDDVPEVSENIIVEKGDIFQLGEHRLMCGDSTSIDDVEKLMDGEKADMVFTDPPYGIDVVQNNSIGGDKAFGKIGGGEEAVKKGQKIIASKTYSKIIGDDTTDTARDVYNLIVTLGIEHIALWGGNYFTDFIPPSRVWWIWNKQTTGNFSQCEMCWTNFEKGGVTIYDFLWNGLAREGDKKTEGKTRVHPTQKPVGMIVNIFNDIKDKTILDLFGGSGSTLIASEKTNRKCYMMELDEKYIQVILKRYYDYTNGEKEIKCLNRELDLSLILD